MTEIEAEKEKSSTKPRCLRCGQEATLYSNEIFSHHYYCRKCKIFVTVPRREGFFEKRPFTLPRHLKVAR